MEVIIGEEDSWCVEVLEEFDVSSSVVDSTGDYLGTDMNIWEFSSEVLEEADVSSSVVDSTGDYLGADMNIWEFSSEVLEEADVSSSVVDSTGDDLGTDTYIWEFKPEVLESNASWSVVPHLIDVGCMAHFSFNRNNYN